MSSSGNVRTDRVNADSLTPAGRYQLVVVWGDEFRTFDLPISGEVSLGRAEDNTIRIDDPSVSRHHVRVHVGETLVVQDLGGANGTSVHERGRATAAGETLAARQLRADSVGLAVGDSFVFGTASAVVRHSPSLELPDLGEGLCDHEPGLVVSDSAMRLLHEQAARAAKATISVLLLGETGVGKEVLARAIHAHSSRKSAPFVGINCAALAESLVESELFGCEKGAFTGAVRDRAGLFEAASGGTVFLDEIGELPLATQAKLLRVIEERAVTRVGATRSRPTDVRFIAATNRDIEAESEAGRFRRDLYFRLNGIALTIPPLRERPADLELLIRSLLAAACRQLEREPLSISSRAFELLLAHGWPGNVRELRNAMERAAVLCADKTILPEHLPPALRSEPKPAARPIEPKRARREPNSTPPTATGTRGAGVNGAKSPERDQIIEALRQCGGNQSRAAGQLGISRRTLISRLGEYELPRPRKKD